MQNFTGQKIGMFQVEARLHEGAESTLYAATQTDARRKAMIKFFPITDASAFTTSMQSLAKLVHPNIVAMYDFGIHAGFGYAIMARVEGESLAQRIQKRGKLDVTEAIPILTHTAAALHYAHLLGVIHNNLKPSNILLDDKHRPYLSDFRVLGVGRSSETLAVAATVIHADYLSPELGQGEIGSRASDIYSLGAIAFHMLSGNLPYVASSPMQVIMKHMNDPLPELWGVSVELEQIIHKAMAKAPYDRYVSIYDFQKALENPPSTIEKPSLSPKPNLPLNKENSNIPYASKRSPVDEVIPDEIPEPDSFDTSLLEPIDLDTEKSPHEDVSEETMEFEPIGEIPDWLKKDDDETISLEVEEELEDILLPPAQPAAIEPPPPPPQPLPKPVAPPAPIPQNVIICGVCGTQNSSASSICVRCGAVLGSDTQSLEDDLPRSRWGTATMQDTPATPGSVPQPQAQPHFGARERQQEARQEEEKLRSVIQAAVAKSKPSLTTEFSAYYPGKIQAAAAYALMVFAHLADDKTRKGIEDTARRFSGMMGSQQLSATASSQIEIAAGTPITFVPKVAGVSFNPPEQTIVWTPTTDPYKSATFLFSTPAHLMTDLKGQVLVFNGALIVGEIPLHMARVEFGAMPELSSEAQMKKYEAVFASYSHKDTPVMEFFRRQRERLGQKMLVDIYDLRAGEHWADRLLQMIEESTAFQLFWSKASAESKYCRQEWEYALKFLDARPRFIQPVWWQEPMPVPPPELEKLHFQRVALPPVTRVQLIAGKMRNWFGG